MCSKSKVTFQISRATSVRSSIFLCHVGTLVPNICTQFQVYSIFNLFLTDAKVRRILVCSAIFCYLLNRCKSSSFHRFFLSFGNSYDPFEQIRIIIDVILLLMCWGVQSKVRHWHLLGHLGRACTTYKLFFTQSGLTVCHCQLINSIFDTKFDANSLIHFFFDSRKSPSTSKYLCICQKQTKCAIHLKLCADVRDECTNMT